MTNNDKKGWDWEKEFDERFELLFEGCSECGGCELVDNLETRYPIGKYHCEYDLEKIKNFIKSVEASAYERGKAEAEEARWWEPCSGCKDGHSSFWKTIVESKEWKSWEKEQRRRFSTEILEGCFDVDECRECGYIGAEHWQEFVKFLATLDNMRDGQPSKITK